MAEPVATSPEELSTWCEWNNDDKVNSLWRNRLAIKQWDKSIPRGSIADIHEVLNNTCTKAASNRGDSHSVERLLIQNDRFALLRLHTDYVCWFERKAESPVWHAITTIIPHTPGAKKSEYMRFRTIFKNATTPSRLCEWDACERLHYPRLDFMQNYQLALPSAVVASAPPELDFAVSPALDPDAFM